jgi:phosphopantothenoylcysteine decarboxylase/phosphopantothenate--cysteine ligase
MPFTMLRDSNLILGVTGSIAAFKALEILRLLIQDEGARVTTILTRHATHFVGPLSFSVLSGRPCLVDQFEAEEMRASFIPPDAPGRVPLVHIDLAQNADLLLVAPASANLLGKVAAGIADDLLTVTIMATGAPVLFAPAMNTRMWENPIVQGNVQRLTELGYHFVGPDSGDLACGVGPGRLAEPADIVAAASGLVRRGPLNGRTVLVTAGRTEEPVDPVRTLSNRSSGKMGYALAAAARDLGARVVLVTGAASVPPPAGVQIFEARRWPTTGRRSPVPRRSGASRPHSTSSSSRLPTSWPRRPSVRGGESSSVLPSRPETMAWSAHGRS